MKVYLDNCLPHRLARALHELDKRNEVVALRDEFAASTPDATWLEAVGAQDEPPVVVTLDRAILRVTRDECTALAEAGVTFFALMAGWSKLEFWELAAKLVGIWPALTRAAAATREPSIFQVPLNGRNVERRGATRDAARR